MKKLLFEIGTEELPANYMPNILKDLKIMTKMEFDLTEGQIEKVNELEEHGISLGEAIDLLFEIKDEALHQMDEVDENIDLVTTIAESMDANKKIEFMEKAYGDSEKTPELKIQEVKHKVSWGRDFFKF